MIKENNLNVNATSQSAGQNEKEVSNPKIKELKKLQEKEFQKRQSREQDIKHEREHGDINQASE